MALPRAQSLLRLMVAVTALAILMAPFARARAPKADATQQLQALVTQAAEAVKAGDFLAGIPPAQQAVRLARKTFGNRDPRTLASLVTLAQIYQLSGRSQEAQPLFGEAVPLLQETAQASRKKLGSRHPQTLISMVGLAQVYQALSRYSDAEPLFREALQTSRETLGPRHPQTLVSIDGLAQIYRALSRYDEAEPLYLEALQARREMLGSRHPEVLSGLYVVAAFYESWGATNKPKRSTERPCRLAAKRSGRAIHRR